MKKWGDDFHTQKAKREGLVARSYYKLEEADSKLHFVRKANSVLDLGCSPGSWVQYVLKHSKAEVYACDLNDLQVTSPRVQFRLCNVLESDLEDLLQGRKVDVLLSDMAPNTTGNSSADVAKSLELCERVLELAQRHLKKDGSVYMKVFMGEGFEELREKVRTLFGTHRLFHPKSTRSSSREIFLFAQGLLS